MMTNEAMNDPKARPHTKLMAYMTGYRVAAGGCAIPPEMERNEDFNRGWIDGRDAKRAAYASACKHYGCTETYLRVA